MSRELWAVEKCDHGSVERHCPHGSGWAYRCSAPCRGGKRELLDFDAIWRRYYETANRRFESGLTYNELWFVVYGEKTEEE